MAKRKKQKSVAEEILAEDAKPKRGRKYTPRFTNQAGEEITGADEVPAASPQAADSLDGQLPPVPVKPKGQRIRKGNLQQYSTDGDLVDIWERRILNPDHRESVPIRIKTVGMRIRWINLSNRGRFQRARYEQGWVPVHRSELMDEREIYGATYTSEGYVCRGEKQGEMLMKIPQAVYRKIQERRTELNVASYKKLRQQMGAAGAQMIKERHGSVAGEQAEEAASQFVGSVKFGNERVTSDELFE